MIDTIKLDNIKIKYVYLIDNVEVSYVLIEVVDVINIIDVFTSEEHRYLGYASRLLNKVFNDYRGYRFMLEVRKSNNNAIALYKKYGFKEIYVRKNYYKDEDGLIMEVIK